MRGLDDGPDGLNDVAFDRALAAGLSPRRTKAARSPHPRAIPAPVRAPRQLDTDEAYDLAAAILADSYGARRDDVEALARWVTERDAAPDDALADARRDLAAAHQRIAQIAAKLDAANNAHQVTTNALEATRAAHGRTANLLLAELEAGIRTHEQIDRVQAEAGRADKLQRAFERLSRTVIGLSCAEVIAGLDAAELAERERQAVQTAELRGLCADSSMAIGGAR